MPGLLRGIARTAVVAGTATAVSGRVQRRQQGRWAAQEQAAAQAAQQTAPPPQPGAETTDPRSDTAARLAQLKELGALRDAGVLTDAEFEAQKGKILYG